MLKITYYPTKNRRFPFCCKVTDGLAAAELIAELRRSDEDLAHRMGNDYASLFRSLASMEKGTTLGFEYPDYLRIDLIQEVSAC